MIRWENVFANVVWITTAIFQELGANNDEAVICGDYNINLLKMNGETHFSDFFIPCSAIVSIQK